MESSERNKLPISCPYLVQIYGQYVNKKFKLSGKEMQIGRHPNSHIKIDSPNVSRNHCTLQFTSHGWTIKDNGSQNGTYINGRSLVKGRIAILQTGDIIFLGPPSEMPQAFCYDDSEEDREHILVKPNNYDSTEMSFHGNNKDLNSASNSTESSIKRTTSSVKNTLKNSDIMTFPSSANIGSESTSNTSESTCACKQLNSSECFSKKGYQKRTITSDKSVPAIKKLNASNIQCIKHPKLPLNNEFPKPCEEESKSVQVKIEKSEVEDSQSLLDDVESGGFFDQDLYPFSQALDESVYAISEDECVQVKSEDNASHEAKNDLPVKEPESELLKSKLALLSEEIKNLEQSKSDLLKEYVDVCEKNKLLDQQLAEQKKLKEDIQMCEIRVRNNFKNQIMEKLEEELICNICTEVLIKPTVLDCSHTFCEHCIAEWIKKKKQCPVCRNNVKSRTRVLALDHFIDKTLETFTPGQKERRKELIKEREQSKVTPSCSRRKSGRARRRQRSYSYRRPPRVTPSHSNIPQTSHPRPSIEVVTEVVDNVAPPFPAIYAELDWSPEVFDISDSDSSLDDDEEMFLQPCFYCGRHGHVHFNCPGL